jgi:hypothetical protein
MMIYTGGIYPLPETILAVALYGVLLAAMTRSMRPLATGLAGGLLGLGLGAPKLLPVLEVMLKHPRLTDSPETLDLSAFVDLLTSHDQDVTSWYPGVSQWSWHEWGMYVGWAVVIAGLAGAILARGPRESAMRWTGLGCFLLGFGQFHKYAPWPLLHHMPVFQSQHVPSRWMYPAILATMIAAVAVLERGLRRTAWARGWLEIAALAGVAWVGRDVARVARVPVDHMFTTPMPQVAGDPAAPFHTERRAPPALDYQSDWVAPTLAMVLANEGSIDCGTFPALHNYIRDHSGHAPGLGAHGVGDPAYKGEAYVDEGTGRADLVKFTPNEMTVAVHGATPGEHVVLNQNWDPGWSAGRARVEEWHEQVSATIDAPEQTFVFRYRPVTWWAGLATFAASVSAVAWVAARRRRARRDGRHATASIAVPASGGPRAAVT